MKEGNMKVNTSVKLLIRILIIIVLIILSIITVFNAGRKFYNLKSTVFDNKKVEYKGKIARWNFDARIKTNIEEINTKYKEYNYKYIIHAYKLKLVQEKTKQDNPPNLIESENKNINEYNIPKEKDNPQKENKDTTVIIKKIN